MHLLSADSVKSSRRSRFESEALVVDRPRRDGDTLVGHAGRPEQKSPMNPLLALNELGQFVWLDHISRSLITGGGLQRLIGEDGLGGVTSNPTIFDKAIAGSADSDVAMHRALDADRNLSNRALAERLIVEDIQLAADVLRPVYDHSDGANGFVSLEVSPGSAADHDGCVSRVSKPSPPRSISWLRP